MDHAAAEALVRDLHRDALSLVLYADEDGVGLIDAGGLVLLHDAAGLRTEHRLDAPDPDDHRIAHAARELSALVRAHDPVAAAIAVTVRGIPDPHEVVLVCAAHRDGSSLANAVQAIPTHSGIVAPGPLVPLDGVALALPETLAAVLRSQALDDPGA